MRFHITCDGGLIEMVGEEITLPNSTDQFVLHANPLDEDWKGWEPFRVTHVKTGATISGGKTIQEAMDSANKKMLSVTSSEFSKLVERNLEKIKMRNLEKIA